MDALFFPFARVGAITRLCDLTAEFGKTSESDVKSVRNRVFPSQNGILLYIFYKNISIGSASIANDVENEQKCLQTFFEM